MNKINLLMILSLSLFLSTQARASTLFEANWDTGTGCSTAAVNSGAWTYCSDGACEQFTVKSGGYGGANYLALAVPSRDLTNHLKNNASMGRPSTMYIRFWFRKNFSCGVMHPLYLNNTTTVDHGFAAWRDWPGSFSIIDNNPNGDIYYYKGSITDGAWYRLEYKIQNPGTSSGSITVRLNGTDITSQMFIQDTSTSLSSKNGSLTLWDMYYINWEMYYGQCAGKSGDWLDIAGFKVTDGPDWIGDDQTLTPPVNLRTSN